MKFLFALVATATLAACATSGTKVQENSLSQFQNGVTTSADVIKALGKPQGNTKLSDGTQSIVYVYSHSQAKGASFIPVVGLFAGGATGEMCMVTFNFDQQGKLLSYQTSNSSTDVHTGITGSTANTSTETTAK